MGEVVSLTHVLAVCLSICLSVITFFLVRTIRQVDKNQSKLFEKFEEHERRISTMEGAHNEVMRHRWHDTQDGDGPFDGGKPGMKSGRRC